MSASLGVVLAAAGSSRRLGFDKLFTPVLGKTVFQFTLEGLLASPDVAHIVVATTEANIPVVQNLLPSPFPKPISVVAGGTPTMVVTHGGVLRLIANRAGVPEAALLPNLGGYWFTVEGSRLVDPQPLDPLPSSTSTDTE